MPEREWSRGVKDSLYYMQDDGVFSEEEKDKEAMEIFRRCSNNAFQRVYFNCSCVAGAFREARDEPRLKPQTVILQDIYSDEESKCINSVAIAGNSYETCLRFETNPFNGRSQEEIDEYCQCVANKTAINFEDTPSLAIRRIERMKVNAMVSCKREQQNPLQDGFQSLF
ncbi:MAG: hypothetical protein AAF549_01055 [Pseudomonadota bacterium]